MFVVVASTMRTGRIWVITAAARLMAINNSHDVHRPAELCTAEELLKTP